MQKRARLNTAKGRNCHGVITETTRTLNGSRGRVPAWVGDAAGWGLRGEASTLGTTGCWQSARGRSPSHTLRLVAWCRPYRPPSYPFAFFKSDFKDETRKRGTGSARSAVRRLRRGGRATDAIRPGASRPCAASVLSPVSVSAETKAERGTGRHRRAPLGLRELTPGAQQRPRPRPRAGVGSGEILGKTGPSSAGLSAGGAGEKLWRRE